jgi:hypothetical protein
LLLKHPYPKKTAMSINTILGIVSTIAFLLPPLIILYSRLFVNVSLLALVVYFLSAIMFNLVSENVIVVPEHVKRNLVLVHTYTNIPLMLISMFLFSSENWKDKMLVAALSSFIAYELIVLFNPNLNVNSYKYITGPGILMVFLFSVHFFITNIRHTIIQGKGLGKTLVVAAILFGYGCYLIVYIFDFLVQTPNKADVLTIYYISSTIFAGIMSAGLVWLKKRYREIQEVRTTRKELHMFFNN